MRRRSFTTHCFSLRAPRPVPRFSLGERAAGCVALLALPPAYQRLTGSSSALVMRSFSTASRRAGRLDAIVPAR